MADDRSTETPQISRSGRVLKKTAKVKEMEDFDINELDMQARSRKKSKSMDDYDEYEDKRIAPIKIPKISLNVQGSKKNVSESTSVGAKQLYQNTFQGSLKFKQDSKRAIYDSSDASKESDSSSMSSESSSSSSSDASDEEENYTKKLPLTSALQSLSVNQDKVIAQEQQSSCMEQSSSNSSDSEDVTSDSALVIAEDSNESSYASRGVKGSAKKRIGTRDPNYNPGQAASRRKTGTKSARPAATSSARRKAPVIKNTALKTKTPSAYMLWCSENQKKIAATSRSIGFASIGKKMSEMWQALPEKEKQAWRIKANKLAMQGSKNIKSSITFPNRAPNKSTANLNDEFMKELTESTGTLGMAPIDAAAHMKLLGDSLTVIGQRLIEHEGQLAVSGIYSVLLDTLLCAIAPLLCLTSEIAALDPVPPEIFRRTLDHIAYFMPGL